MTTKLMEASKHKCARYWPAERGMTLRIPLETGGELLFKTMTESEQLSGFKQTELELTFGKEKRQITHFWFDSWPDHGVPRNADGTLATDDLIDMLQRVREVTADHPEYPTVILSMTSLCPLADDLRKTERCGSF